MQTYIYIYIYIDEEPNKMKRPIDLRDTRLNLWTDSKCQSVWSNTINSTVHLCAGSTALRPTVCQVRDVICIREQIHLFKKNYLNLFSKHYKKCQYHHSIIIIIINFVAIYFYFRDLDI